MTTLQLKIQKFEFESRIFISFGLVASICALSLSIFAHLPTAAVILGGLTALPAPVASALGFVAAALAMAAASFLRIWAGSALTSRRMMSFQIKTDELLTSGPYRIVRNPIYLADLMAFTGFVFVLPPIGLLLPVLLFLHYTQLIAYEEISLRREFGPLYAEYEKRVPRLLPGAGSGTAFRTAIRDVAFTRDGIRHNALYLFFIPGFVLAAATGTLLQAVAIGLPAVVDWAIVHTRTGIKGRAFGSPLARDFYARASTAEIDPRAKLGAPAGAGVRAKAPAPAAVAKKPTAVKAKVFEDVLYANAWEDPAVDRAAFCIQPSDVVLSITSGGCNVLAFLLDDPRKVIALDLNPHQNHLLELKMAAFRKLSYRQLLAFFGVRPSAARLALYRERLRPVLSDDARRFWDGQPAKIARGLIHAGRYEKYMRLLRKILITPTGRQRLARKMFEAEDPAERERLYRRRWLGPGWTLLTRVMLSRRLNSLLFDKAFFAYLDRDVSFGRHFAAKAEHALLRLPLKDNYFLSYILFGRYYDERHLPPYLRPENFRTIRDRIDRIEIVTDSGTRYLAGLEDSSVTKFNFSNIFEWMPPQAFEELLRETVRVACDGAILTYRNLLVPRERPASLEPWIRPRPDLAGPLGEADLSFIYDRYVVEQVEKK
jgi:S-adenosylmethionine-diacylglycerol 3-amino-3-carboxypropyl transferase